MIGTKSGAKMPRKAASSKKRRKRGTPSAKRAVRRKPTMAGAGPLEVSQRVGNGISRAVEDFAHKQKLDHDLWYHDDSMWRVRSKREDTYREIQIAAFSWKRDECLFFIPQAYRFENGSVKAAKQKVVEGLITSLPLSKLETSDDESIAKDVGRMLPAAWSNAESISEKDLELVKGRK